MKTNRTVFLKEITDNFRDRRTLMTALLMGPLFGPILFAFVINLSVKQSLSDENEALDLPVIGQQHAPNLIAYLQSNNINIVAAPATREAAIDAVTNGEQDVVIVIPESFGADLAELTPATVEVISDQANTQAQREGHQKQEGGHHHQRAEIRRHAKLLERHEFQREVKADKAEAQGYGHEQAGRQYLAEDKVVAFHRQAQQRFQ